jgi:elongation factor G
MGSVEKGNTVCDADPEERESRHSFSPAVVGFDYEGRRINVIDTPGLPDFAGQTLSVLPAVETVAVVVNAMFGIELITRRAMDWARQQHFCRMIIVNKIDAASDRRRCSSASRRFSAKNVYPSISLPRRTQRRRLFFPLPAETAAFSSAGRAHGAGGSGGRARRAARTVTSSRATFP